MQQQHRNPAIKEMAFRIPRDNAPSGMMVKVIVPPGFSGVDKYKRVDKVARLIYEAAYGWVDLSELMLKRSGSGKLYVDDCALVAVLVAQSCAKSVQEMRRVESVGRMLLHLSNPEAKIPLTDVERFNMGLISTLPEKDVDEVLATQKPYRL
jgi:hypothetical protein